MGQPMTQNELYELVAEHGEFYGMSLRRDSYLLRGVDQPESWLEIADEIGEDRARLLSEGAVDPLEIELSHLIRWQADQALAEENDAIVPAIWLCQPDDDSNIIVIEGWGRSIDTELKFVLIGRYPTEIDAIHEIRR
jgi:hypothetical protein